MDQLTSWAHMGFAPFSVETNKKRAALSTETLQSPTSSQQMTHQGLLPPSDEVSHIHASSPVGTVQKCSQLSAKLPQTPQSLSSKSEQHSPGEKCEMPPPSPENTHQFHPSTPVGHMHTSTEQFLKDTVESPGLAPEETCQVQEPSLENTNEGLVPYPEAAFKSFVPSPTMFQQDHTQSSERAEGGLELTPVNFPRTTNIQESSSRSNVSAGDHQDGSGPSDPGHAQCLASTAEFIFNPVSSHPCPSQQHKGPPNGAPVQSGLSPTRFQPGSAESRRYQESETRLLSPSSPKSIMNSQPKQSPSLCNPLEAGASNLLKTLHQVTSGTGLSQNRSCSAPCSPNPPLAEPRPHTFSQPVSPGQPHCNRTMFTTEQSLDSDGLKLEVSSAKLNSTSDPCTAPSPGSSSAPLTLTSIPAQQTPEGLDNSSASLKHSSLTHSPCVQDTKLNTSPHRSLSPRIEAAKGDSPTQAEPVPENPAFCLKIFETPFPTHTFPTPRSDRSVPASSPTRPDCPKSPPVRSLMEPQPDRSSSDQDKAIEIQHDRPVHKEALTGLDLSLSKTESSPTHFPSSASPYCAHTCPDSSLFVLSLTTTPSSGDSSQRISYAGQASPVHVVQAPTPSPISPPQSPAQNQTMPHRPTSKTGTSSCLPQAPQSPATHSDLIQAVSLTPQDVVLPTKALLDGGAAPTAEPEMERKPTQVCSKPDHLCAAGPEDVPPSPGSVPEQGGTDAYLVSPVAFSAARPGSGNGQQTGTVCAPTVGEYRG